MYKRSKEAKPIFGRCGARFIRVTVMLAFSVSVSTYSQEKRPHTNPPTKCGDDSPFHTDENFFEFYRRSVFDYFEPPDWSPALITISVRGEATLKLWTDGKRFTLWTYTTRPRNILKYLDKLNDSCRLPGNPSEAARLIKVKWESADISSEKFAQIHRNLTNALAKYAASAGDRFGSEDSVIYLDATGYRVEYDNRMEHIKVEVMEDPKQYKPILDWIHDLQKVAEDKFHRRY